MKNVTRISNFPEIVFCEEEALRFFSLITKSSKKTTPSVPGESIKFIASMSTRRNKKEEKTTWKFSLGVNMSVILLDSEIREDIVGNRFVGYLMKLMASKVVSSINREREKQQQRERERKKSLERSKK